MKNKVLLLGVFFNLLSCASGQLVLDNSQLRPYKDMSQVTTMSNTKVLINLVAVNDKRVNESIGTGYSGVQYTPTPVFLQEKVSLYLQSYFKDAFAIRNIQVSSESSKELEIDIDELLVEERIEKHNPEKAFCRGKITYHLSVGTEKWSGTFWTEYLSAGDLSDGTERLAPTFASCMNELVEKLVTNEEFKNLIL